MHISIIGSVPRFVTIHAVLLALLMGPGCASLDPDRELKATAEATRRVSENIDPAEAWSLPVEGESPAWNGADSLTYEAAVAVSLQGNPGIRRNLAVVVERRAWYVQEGLPPNPTVGFGIGIAVDGMSGAPMMVQGLQMLSWLWKNPHRVAAAEAELRAAVYDAAFGCVDVTMRTRTQMAAVLAAQDLLRYDLTYTDITDQTVRLVEAQVEAGELPALELDRAQLEHQEAIESVVASEYSLEQAKLALLGTMGRPTDSTSWVAAGELPPVWNIPDDERTLLELAITGRLDIASAREAVLKIQAELGLAETEKFPEIGIGLGYRRNAGDRKSVSPEMKITVPILDNGDPAIAIQTARLDAALMELLATIENAQAGVLTSLSRYEQSRDRARLIRTQQLKIARTAQQRSDAAFREGVVDLNTLLMTQRQLIAVERNLVLQELMTMEAMCELRTSVGGSFDPTLDAAPIIVIEAKSSDSGQEESS